MNNVLNNNDYQGIKNHYHILYAVLFGIVQLLWLCYFVPATIAQTSYFQQKVHYEIRVRLDDQTHYLHGFEKIIYVNQSDSLLDEIGFHLWPNAYKHKHTAFARQQRENGSLNFHYANSEERGFIDSLDFRIGEDRLSSRIDPEHDDLLWVQLPKALNPGDSITITTPFRVKIPADFSRFGHHGNQYQITQWYPKPAVFDHKGWHLMPYLDQGEFYSEIGTYDVVIEVPAHYVVGATGNLMDNLEEEKFLQQREQHTREYLNKKRTALPDLRDTRTGYKELRFTQSRIHDFAWFCDPDYLVLTDTLRLPNNHKTVNVRAMFNKQEARLWQKATQYIKEGVYYYSLWVGDYPYEQVTAVRGALKAGGGMEYPNITVIAATNSADDLRRVIIHEVGHNWFYGVLASNERQHPWLDEGFNSYYEERTMAHLERSVLRTPLRRNKSQQLLQKLTPFFKKAAFKYAESINRIQAIDLPADQYTSMNYGIIVYTRSVYAIQYLEEYLGKEVFDRCMKVYFDRWKFRHPYPEDVQEVFEDVSGQELGWFFQSLVRSARSIDFSIKKVKYIQPILYVEIENKTPVPLPVEVILLNVKGDTIYRQWTASFFNATTIAIENPGDWRLLIVNPAQTLSERHIHNNTFYNRPLFSRWLKPAVRLGYAPEDLLRRHYFVLR